MAEVTEEAMITAVPEELNDEATGPRCPAPSAYHSTVVIGDNLYLWGIESIARQEHVQQQQGRNSTSKIDIFNLHSAEWTEKQTKGSIMPRCMLNKLKNAKTKLLKITNLLVSTVARIVVCHIVMDTHTC